MSSSTKITKPELEYIAKLARIKLTEEEKDIFLPQLESVLEYFDVLNKVNTDGVEPTYQVNSQKNIFREDKILPSLTQEEALSSTHKKQDGYFVVTATIKK
jgi:aspartyl-tRNA(Asn)/glutamyl-tRNA(Gln) amidotransferase subunit C